MIHALLKRILHRIFQTDGITKTVGGTTQSNLVKKRGFVDYFEYTKKCRNFDPANFGDWQIGYSEMMSFALDIKDKKILDIGCAAGAMVYGFSREQAKAYGCDVNIQAIQTSPFPINNKLSVVETSEIGQYYAGANFDIFHSQQVFEHFPGKEYSEKVVRGIYEITAHNALGYVALVTGEHMTEEDLRNNPQEDATHINIWPMDYWLSLFTNIGFVDVTEWFSPIIMCYHNKKNEFSFYKEYNWHQLFISKGNIDARSLGKNRLIRLLEHQKGYANVKIYKDVMKDCRVNDECRSIIKNYI
jgi:2-polyprenyl-3-methyl-5-hydroxy-6-metoxy-1,4-benzoquinol methylase